MLAVLIAMLLAVPLETDERAAAERASRLLADTFSYDIGSIEPVRVEAARWDDASLGCPEGDREYDQKPTEGYRVLLRAGRRIHVVHVAGERALECRPRLPERVPPRPADPGATGEVPERFVQTVVADLIEHQGISGDDVEVVVSEARLWPDGGLGCPEPGRLYMQVQVRGYRVLLRAGDETFDYRLDGRGNFKLCDTGLNDTGDLLPAR